ncbi:MAG: copper homeostasis protein CutC [Bacteroidia bacterium]|nr:copper homeostasis protein CutC [Bacteroidia bacterium]
MNRLLEIACFSEEAATVAFKAGAHRIELCDNYCVGGITPSFDVIQAVRNNISLPLHVIIRPREGNYVYTQNEIEQMCLDFEFCKKAGVDGIVFGILTAENKVDEAACKELLKRAGNLPCTFHRAVDSCFDRVEALQTLVNLGFKKVLTSGGADHVMEGLSEISHMQNKFGKLISIMPGGGLRATNLKKVITESNCTEFHSAALKPGSDLPNSEEIKKLLQVLNGE